MLEILKFAEVIIAILMIFVILIQNKNVTLNLSDMSWGMWEITKRWPEKIMQNITVVLWTLFIINSLVLYIL